MVACEVDRQPIRCIVGVIARIVMQVGIQVFVIIVLVRIMTVRMVALIHQARCRQLGNTMRGCLTNSRKRHTSQRDQHDHQWNQFSTVHNRNHRSQFIGLKMKEVR